MPDALDWRALEEEMHRPIPKATRVELEISWRELPGLYRVRKSLTSLDREELADLAQRVVAELARQEEGPLTVARLLARWELRGKRAS